MNNPFLKSLSQMLRELYVVQLELNFVISFLYGKYFISNAAITKFSSNFVTNIKLRNNSMFSFNFLTDISSCGFFEAFLLFSP